MKHGFYIQIWKDGTRYESSSRLNIESGKGAFCDVYQDQFEEDWLDDNVKSYSVYVYQNGAIFNG